MQGVAERMFYQAFSLVSRRICESKGSRTVAFALRSTQNPIFLESGLVFLVSRCCDPRPVLEKRCAFDRGAPLCAPIAERRVAIWSLREHVLVQMVQELLAEVASEAAERGIMLEQAVGVVVVDPRLAAPGDAAQVVGH